jgi:hypothetical protein
MSTMIDGLNLLDGSWYAEDPHGIFDEMRRTDPVHYDLELATEDPLPRRASNFVSGLESMPVTFTPTPVEV